MPIIETDQYRFEVKADGHIGKKSYHQKKAESVPFNMEEWHRKHAIKQFKNEYKIDVEYMGKVEDDMSRFYVMYFARDEDIIWRENKPDDNNKRLSN